MGTKPTDFPSRRHPSAIRCMAETVVTIRIPISLEPKDRSAACVTGGFLRSRIITQQDKAEGAIVKALRAMVLARFSLILPLNSVAVLSDKPYTAELIALLASLPLAKGTPME